MEELEQNCSNIMKPWRDEKINCYDDFSILNCIYIFNTVYWAWPDFQKSKN